MYQFYEVRYDPIQYGFADAGEYPAVRCPRCDQAVHAMTKLDSAGKAYSVLWCRACNIRQAGVIYPRSKTGISKHQLARWAMQVRARAEGKCQRCGAPGIHAHHIIPRWKDPTKAIDLNNGIYLCGKCHAEAHQHDRVGIHPDLKKYLEESSNDRYLDPRQTADGDGPTKGQVPLRRLV